LRIDTYRKIIEIKVVALVKMSNFSIKTFCIKRQGQGSCQLVTYGLTLNFTWPLNAKLLNSKVAHLNKSNNFCFHYFTVGVQTQELAANLKKFTAVSSSFYWQCQLFYGRNNICPVNSR